MSPDITKPSGLGGVAEFDMDSFGSMTVRLFFALHHGLAPTNWSIQSHTVTDLNTKQTLVDLSNSIGSGIRVRLYFLSFLVHSFQKKVVQ